MATLKGMEELFKGRHFEQEIIILCVRWYLRYKLFFRDLAEMMEERGLAISIARCPSLLLLPTTRAIEATAIRPRSSLMPGSGSVGRGSSDTAVSNEKDSRSPGQRCEPWAALRTERCSNQ